MLVQSEAIILHHIKYNDQSVIVKAYSRNFGIISLIVPVSRRNGSKVALLQALSMVEIVFYLNKNGGLHRLKEIRSSRPYKTIPFSPGKTAQTLFLSELILKSVKEEEENTPLYGFIQESLIFFDCHEKELPDFHIKFMLEFTRFLGFSPTNNFDAQTPWFSIREGCFLPLENNVTLDKGTSQAISVFLKSGYQNLIEIRLGRMQRGLIVRKILEYYRWHLPSAVNFKSPDILEEVFD